MPRYSYSALDHTGHAAAGDVDAPTRQQAITGLAETGLFVTDLSEDDSRAGTVEGPPDGWQARQRLSPRNRAALLRQLGTAVDAGLPLLTALRAIEQQADTARLRRMLHDLAQRVQGGESLSEAMRQHPRAFTPMHVSMIRAGETAGVLDQVVASLADFAERDLQLREEVRSASTYPAIVLSLALVSVVVILAFILPRIMATVTESVAILPWPTRFLLALSDLLRGWGWVIALVLVGSIGACVAWVRRPEGRLAFDRLKLRVPVLGRTLRTLAVARLARTLGTLSGAGIEILESLHVLRDTLGNEALARAVDDVRHHIAQGQFVAAPLERTGQFPAMFIQVIALGERTGRLDELLLRAADAYDREAAVSIGRTMTVLPALFIIVLALVVGFILASVLLPIVSMQAAIPGL